MTKQDLLYACRSGIQKAIRRGDLDLGRTCLAISFNELKDYNWLQWRLPAIVQEEAVHMLGETAEFLAGQPEDEKEWRKFLYTLILTPKNPDASALLRFYMAEATSDHPEFQAAQEYLSRAADPEADLRTIALDIGTDYLAARPDGDFSLYEARAIDLLVARTVAGGKEFDRRNILTSLILIAARGMPKDKVRKLQKQALDPYLASGKKPQMIELPWYVFDMHTSIGLEALGMVGRKWAQKVPFADYDFIKMLWFTMESGLIPPAQAHYVDFKEGPTIFESIWQIQAIRARLSVIEGKTPQDLVKLWKKIQPDLKAAVEVVLQKRGGWNGKSEEAETAA